MPRNPYSTRTAYTTAAGIVVCAALLAVVAVLLWARAMPAGPPARCVDALVAAGKLAAAVEAEHPTASAAVDAAQHALTVGDYRAHAKACAGS